MYNELEVFEEINKFVGNEKSDVERAYKIHRKLLKYIPIDGRDQCFFRYLDKGGTIGLNLRNYKIYEYPFEKRESFRIIYPIDQVNNLKNVGLEANINFKFISAPAVLLEVKVSDFELFEEEQWMSFNEGMKLAMKGKDYEKNIRNIDISW